MIYGAGFWQARIDGGVCRRLNAAKILSSLSGQYLLDVGCGEGNLLEVARERGWDATGVEPNCPGFTSGIYPGTVSEAQLPLGKYDVITLIDVIEHLRKPIEDLNEIKILLKRGGLIYILTPNAGGLIARLMGRFWFERKPEHLHLYNSTEIGNLLHAAGFVWVETGVTGKILTLSYIASILAKDKFWLAPFVRLLGKVYRRQIHFKGGFIVATGRNI